MARRSDHTRDELKNLIFQAAWAIVGREGYGALTARRLAKEIGYAPGTIYNIYASMDDLCLAVKDRTMDLLYEALAGAACPDPARPVAANLKAMARLYMDFAHKNRNHWLMLFDHRLAEGRELEDWYVRKINSVFQPLELLLAPLFGKNQAKKRNLAARVLWTSVHGMCLMQEAGKNRVMSGHAAQEMADYLIDLFIFSQPQRRPG